METQVITQTPCDCCEVPFPTDVLINIGEEVLCPVCSENV